MISPIRFQPRFGGPAVTLHDNGSIEVDGLGFIKQPKWRPAIDKWQQLITKSAAKRDVPEAWIAGFMYCESAGVQAATSPVGAVGLMQIMPSTPSLMFGEHPSRDQLYAPPTNIDYGARILNALARKHSWNIVHVASSYNSGGMYPYTGKNCGHDGMWHNNENCGYSECVVRSINSAIDAGYSGVGARTSSSTWLKIAASVAALAAGAGVVMLAKSRIK